jgi:hypothetical protein
VRIETYLRTALLLFAATACACGGPRLAEIPEAGTATPGAAESEGGVTSGFTSAPDASETFFADTSTPHTPSSAADDAASDASPPWAFMYSGSVNGLVFAPADGVAYVDKGELVIVLSDASSLCSEGVDRQGSMTFSIELYLGAAPSPATFSATAGQAPGQAALNVTELGASCAPAGLDLAAESGTVTLATVSASVVAGTFSVDLAGGAGTLSGSFSVPLCGAVPSTACTP